MKGVVYRRLCALMLAASLLVALVSPLTTIAFAKPLDKVLSLLDELERGIIELVGKVKVVLVDVLKVITGLCIGLGAVLWLLGFRYEGKRLLLLGIASVLIIGILSV